MGDRSGKPLCCQLFYSHLQFSSQLLHHIYSIAVIFAYRLVIALSVQDVTSQVVRAHDFIFSLKSFVSTPNTFVAFDIYLLFRQLVLFFCTPPQIFESETDLFFLLSINLLPKNINQYQHIIKLISWGFGVLGFWGFVVIV